MSVLGELRGRLLLLLQGVCVGWLALYREAQADRVTSSSTSECRVATGRRRRLRT
jgi:hypothetical protein